MQTGGDDEHVSQLRHRSHPHRRCDTPAGHMLPEQLNDDVTQDIAPDCPDVHGRGMSALLKDVLRSADGFHVLKTWMAP